jgi:ribonuclease HI
MKLKSVFSAGYRDLSLPKEKPVQGLPVSLQWAVHNFQPGAGESFFSEAKFWIQPMKEERTRRFLSDIEKTLDLKKTAENLDMKEEELKEIISSIKERLFGGVFLNIYFDGASRGNPGEAGAGAVIKDGHGKILKRVRKHLGVQTNNAAEYMALIMALKEAKSLGAGRVRIFSDSELLVRQIKAQYRVKSENLRKLHSEALLLCEFFEDFTIEHIEREKNTEADRLANEAIDGV